MENYYELPGVRSRIIEYCGGSRSNPATCTARFLVADGQTIKGPGILRPEVIFPPRELDTILSRQVDVFRSLWDRTSIVAMLDVDYSNIDFVDEAFVHPEDTFNKLEPVYQLITSELKALGIDHLSIMTGRGYHFVWRVALTSKLKPRLESLCLLPPTLESKYRGDHPFTPETTPLGVAAAFAGTGLLLEYLVHLILAKVPAGILPPTVANGLIVGSGTKGREAISLDLSAYGDPLYTRHGHCAFSLYHKKTAQGQTLVCLPRNGRRLEDMLKWRADPLKVSELATERVLAIPEATRSAQRLLEAYLGSPLRRFHLYFDSGWHDKVEEWPRTYDRLDLSTLPPCVALPLSYPNDPLLVPNNLQNVARVLVSLGWHPKSVAGLIRSKYERDHGWGIYWLVYDAAARADFYTRLFCGLIVNKIDDLRDFNCISHQEQGFCPRPWCGHNLADYRRKLEAASWN